MSAALEGQKMPVADLEVRKIHERAQRCVRTAISQGVLARPEACQKCGATGITKDGRSFVHAHHYKGYDFPFDVEWLCPTCHARSDPHAKKEKNGRAKLTQDQVDAIRREFRPGASIARKEGGMNWLGRKYGVDGRTIARLLKEETWRMDPLEAAIKAAADLLGPVGMFTVEEMSVKITEAVLKAYLDAVENSQQPISHDAMQTLRAHLEVE